MAKFGKFKEFPVANFDAHMNARIAEAEMKKAEHGNLRFLKYPATWINATDFTSPPSIEELEALGLGRGDHPMGACRTMTSNPDAERALIGACLIGDGLLDAAVKNMHPSEFYDTRTRRAFEIIQSLYGTGRACDPVVIIDESARDGGIRLTQNDIASFIDACSSATNLPRYIVHGKGGSHPPHDRRYGQQAGRHGQRPVRARGRNP